MKDQESLARMKGGDRRSGVVAAGVLLVVVAALRQLGVFGAVASQREGVRTGGSTRARLQEGLVAAVETLVTLNWTLPGVGEPSEQEGPRGGDGVEASFWTGRLNCSAVDVPARATKVSERVRE